MKFLILLTILVSMIGCGKEEKTEKYCSNEYVSNAEGTECICPNDTHTEVTFESGNSTCIENTKEFYLCTLSGDLCFNDGDFTAFDGNGYAQFYFDTFNSLNLTFGGSAQQSIGLAFNAQFTEVNTIELPDGKLEVSMIYVHPTWSDDCFDWATRAEECPSNVKGYIHGISNIDRSIIDLNVEWKDCDGTVLNTGTIHLEKP